MSTENGVTNSSVGGAKVRPRGPTWRQAAGEFADMRRQEVEARVGDALGQVLGAAEQSLRQAAQLGAGVLAWAATKLDKI